MDNELQIKGVEANEQLIANDTLKGNTQHYKGVQEARKNETSHIVHHQIVK